MFSVMAIATFAHFVQEEIELGLQYVHLVVR